MNIIYTFGYGNRPNYDTLLQYLTEYDIKHLADIRLNPKGWSRIWWADKLRDFCSKNDVLSAYSSDIG